MNRTKQTESQMKSTKKKGKMNFAFFHETESNQNVRQRLAEWWGERGRGRGSERRTNGKCVCVCVYVRRTRDRSFLFEMKFGTTIVLPEWCPNAKPHGLAPTIASEAAKKSFRFSVCWWFLLIYELVGHFFVFAFLRRIHSAPPSPGRWRQKSKWARPANAEFFFMNNFHFNPSRNEERKKLYLKQNYCFNFRW